MVDIWLTASHLVNEANEVYAISTTEREIKKGSRENERYGYKDLFGYFPVK